jgi:tetratricopeptide (TPR) repeat protein
MKDTEILKEIDRYIDGKLNRKETDELWVRFLENPEYYKWFETDLHLRKLAADAYQKKGERNNGGEANPKHPVKLRPWAYALAAALLVVVGLSLFLLQERSSVYSLAIDRIDYSELAGADIYRSDEAATPGMDVLINQGLAYAYNNEERRAVEHFTDLLDRNPDGLQRARIQMNLGILHYNMRSFDEAAIHFNHAAENEETTLFFREKAWWFLGNAYLNLRDFENARQAVVRVTELDGRYLQEAENLLNALNGN